LNGFAAISSGKMPANQKKLIWRARVVQRLLLFVRVVHDGVWDDVVAGNQPLSRSSCCDVLQSGCDFTDTLLVLDNRDR
jgi:hypothetical protein